MSARVVVVGGGIAGLSAAWRLQQASPEVLDITVLEAGDRWGGKIVTPRFSGPDGEAFSFDAGPESFITRKREAWQLSLELGLHDALFEPPSETKGMHILDGGRVLAVPLSPVKFVSSPLLTAGGKLRMMAEPFIKARQDSEDESLAAFAARRLGREAAEKFIGPILGGIYNANPDVQSILTTSPVMREMERENGSLVAAAIARGRAKRKRLRAGEQLPPTFFTFRDGADTLVHALTAQLRADLQLNTTVDTIVQAGDHYVVRAGERHWAADAVILACPANASAGMVRALAPEASARLAEIRHNHIGTIALAYRNDDLPPVGRISGLMIPRREGRRIDAITWSSTKVPGRAPDGFTVIRVFFGGGTPATAELGDDGLLAVVREEVGELLGVSATPVAWHAERWLNGFPQADVGHLDRVAAIEAALPARIFLAGASYRGIGVPDCVRQGTDAARNALAQL